MNYFVTAIGTDSGKTLVSAILVEMLEADYWKPVQAGYPTDSERVSELITNSRSRIYKEGYLLQTPESPHAAAKKDQVMISLEKIVAPVSNRDLIIEGAGGVLVPLNEQHTVLDMVPYLQAQIVLVSNFYLGSINHTLLTAEAIKARRYPVKGIIFNGPANEESEAVILQRTGYKKLLAIDQEKQVDPLMVQKYAKLLKSCWD